MDFNRPDVYVQDVSQSSVVSAVADSSVGILIGAMKSGEVGVPVSVTSWTEFIQKFANGLDTPFMENSDLPYSVYGFFLNGGSRVYVVRVASDTAKAATATGTTNTWLTITAKYPGNISPVVNIKQGADYVASTNEVFDVTITMSNTDEGTVTIQEVTKDTIIDAINNNIISKEWVVASQAVVEDEPVEITSLATETITLKSGADGITDLDDDDFKSALETCNTIHDATFIAIPGETSTDLNTALMEYADEHLLFPFLDMPVGSTVKSTRDYRRNITKAFGGALLYPWGVITDPLTNTQKKVPASGYVMGVYSRVILERGVHKAPAGTEAIVRGFVSLEASLTDDDIGTLNSAGVIPIVNRYGIGIVVWGARGLNNASDMKYVSDVLLNYNIKKSLYNATQFAVFEPNDDVLWGRVTATCEDILETLRNQGALQGDKDSAYSVICNASNNTAASIANGVLYVDIAYAPSKPAEFVVIRLSHSMQS